MENGSRGSRRWVATVAAAFFLLSGVGRGQDQPAKIPVAHGTSLAGTAVVLPDALKGKVGVLVLGFSHGSQQQVTNWGRLITADYGKAPGFAYFEIPMLGGAPKMIRGMMIKSMGSSVPAAERPHFIPLTEDDKPWRAVAHYDKADDAYVLLVDGDGMVLWQAQGDATDAAYFALKKKLDGVLAAGGAH
jgi:hypothetical protein